MHGKRVQPGAPALGVPATLLVPASDLPPIVAAPAIEVVPPLLGLPAVELVPP